MVELVFSAAPDVWVPDLGGQIRDRLNAGRLVLWRSVSGALLVLANVATDGGIDTVGIRRNRFDAFASDGVPLVMGRIEATSCGLWSPHGYSSSRPVTVHAYRPDDDAADPDELYEVWKARMQELAESDDPHAWLRQVPDRHPDEPCPVAHCPVQVAQG